MNTHPIKRRIEELYDDFTPVEKCIADYLLAHQGMELPSAKGIAKELYVSEAALTRFAKRCGYSGFRELCFNFRSLSKESDVRDLNALTEKVALSYQQLLARTFAVVDEEQLRRVSAMILTAGRIFIYGMGNSGIAAEEYMLRFLRIGLNVEAIREEHLMRITSALVDEKTLIFALSISGTTKEIQAALRLTHDRGAKTVLITAGRAEPMKDYCDEILRVGSLRYLNTGTVISPQLPLLLMLDLFYYYLIQKDYAGKMSIHSKTASALQLGGVKIEE